jgi:glycosyltransferase involved in cell wall biosynthesis
MRIVCAAHQNGRIGGVESYLADVIPALRAAGHGVAGWFETADAARQPILSAADGITSWVADADPRSFDALREWRPDVIFAHGFRSPAHERRLLDIAPAIFFAHSYYGTCISGSKTQQSPSPVTCEREFGWRCLALYYPRQCGGRNPLTMARQYRLQHERRTLLERYERIVVASGHMAREYARHGLGGKVRVAPLPVAQGPATLPARPDSAEWRVLYLGRLEHTKGALIALESAAAVSESAGRPVTLQISGEGSLMTVLRQRAARLRDTHPRLRVEITGWIDARERTASLERADLLLVPSYWPEPFGLVGPEAGARGLPAVAFAVGGIPEWLTDGVNGRLVAANPPSVPGFAAAILDCLGDPERLRAMRERSRLAAARHTLSRHIAQLEEVFSAAASRPTAMATAP